MRPSLPLSRLFLLCLVVAACDPHPAGAVVDGVWLTRQADGTWAADVDVTAYATTGGDIGAHCVSAHYFGVGADLSLTSGAPAYWGERELVYQCFAGGLRDGDTRRVRLVSKNTDIPSRATVRAQVLAAGRFDVRDTVAP